jgi:hypothetical protein
VPGSLFYPFLVSGGKGLKVFLTALFIIMLVGVAPAQTPAAAEGSSDLQVIGKRWKDGYTYRYYVGESGGERSGWDRTRRTAGRARIGRRPDFLDTTRTGFPFPAPGFSDMSWVKGYFYEATIKNVGTKKIKAVRWEYVFADPHDQSVVTRHRFYTKSKISPGKEKKLVEFSKTPPTHIINAKAVEDNPEHPYTEQLLIQQIEYADGSIWERAAK